MNTSTAFTFSLLEESLWTYSIIVNAAPAVDDDTLSVVVGFTVASCSIIADTALEATIHFAARVQKTNRIMFLFCKSPTV